MRRTIDNKTLNEVVNLLKLGGTVAIPTETVYGLAADASNEVAVAKIFKIKGRPADHPLIVHLASVNQLTHWAKSIPEYAMRLADAFWPGPMTLILKKQDHVLSCITGGQDTVGIRIPGNEIAHTILEAFDGGLAAPSANSFGHISPTLASHVHNDLGDKVDLIIDGGICSIGIESTIIDCTGNQPQILRPGMITEQVIAAATGLPLNQDTKNETRVSGALDSHYAPYTKTVLMSEADINALDKTNVVILSRQKPKTTKWQIHDARVPRVAYKIPCHSDLYKIPACAGMTTSKKTQKSRSEASTKQSRSEKDEGRHWIIMPGDADAYAHSLYEQLHFADQLSCDKIIIEETPNTPEWDGVNDRLRKASF